MSGPSSNDHIFVKMRNFNENGRHVAHPLLARYEITKPITTPAKENENIVHFLAI